MIDFVKAGQLIALYEKEYFTGSFSEKVIRDDLQSRKASDAYSKMGSSGRQTYLLPEKKNFYIKEFTSGLNDINTVLNATKAHQSWDSALISRCEKCRDQADKLLNIVRNFS